MPAPTVTRRTFFASGIAAGAALLTCADGNAQFNGSNERLSIGVIGAGRRGQELIPRIRADVTAVCDVDEKHLHQAASLAGAQVRPYKNYRELINLRALDGVVIATPDHWHALQAVQACEAGKDVFIESPAARTLGELIAIRAAARRSGAIMHVSAPGIATEAMASTKRYLDAGSAGSISEVVCWSERNPSGGNSAASALAPPELNWDAWLGPSRWRPYNPDYAHEKFRWMLDLGGGHICHAGANVFATALWCMNIGSLGKVKVESAGTANIGGLWDCPTLLSATFHISAWPGLLRWEQREAKDIAKSGIEFKSQNDTVAVKNSGETSEADSKVAGAAQAGNVASPPLDELANWMEDVRSRTADADRLTLGINAATLAILANLAYRLGRPLEWDDEHGVFVNDAEADKMITEPPRGNWHV